MLSPRPWRGLDPLGAVLLLAQVRVLPASDNSPWQKPPPPSKLSLSAPGGTSLSTDVSTGASSVVSGVSTCEVRVQVRLRYVRNK